MEKRGSSEVDPNLLGKVEESPAARIWCQRCGTDEFVLVERARWRRRHGEGVWDIDYFCTNCGSFCGHVVRNAEVPRTLAAAMAAVRD
jgi:hypothetical protein